ncbi:MAG: tetratricopeptide repeat protein [Allosphingosinicella sp.]
MGWIVLLVAAGAAFVAIWRFARLDAAGLQVLGAALLLAVAGYAWQGHPSLAGAPKRAVEQKAVAESDFAAMRRDMMGRFDTADHWLTMAEAYAREGDTRGAADIIRAGLKAHPDNATLWVGYGNALVMHSGGLMTPAAQLAFDRAARLAPNHPGPKFFYGLSLAQNGRLEEAEQVWRALLATAPADAQWRAQVEQQIAAVEQARAMGQGR